MVLKENRCDVTEILSENNLIMLMKVNFTCHSVNSTKGTLQKKYGSNSNVEAVEMKIGSFLFEILWNKGKYT